MDYALGCVGLLLAAAGAQGAATLEAYELRTGLPGNVEIPRLGTWDGRTIYCVYSNDTQSVWIQATEDAGRTWSAPVRVLALEEPWYMTDANVLVDRDRITVFATHCLETPGKPGVFGHSVFRVAASEDGGVTWVEQPPIPVPHRYLCGCVHAPVWLEGDRVVMGYSWDVPAEEGRAVGEEGAMHLRAGVLISEDRGRTWAPGADVDLPQQAMGADEPGLVRLANGDLFMVVRTTEPRPSETVSHDGGLTWEPLRPAPVQACNTPTALLRLRDGTIVRAWDDSPATRYPLVVATSTDECQSWSTPRVVTEPAPTADGTASYDWACYPTLAEAADGTVLLAWWQRKGERNSVWVARLSRAWIDEARTLPAPRRIVALGDSVTRGVREGVLEGQTFRRLLEAELGQQGIGVRVLDAGVPSDTTVQGLARLERDVLSQRPELVIVMFGLNDAAMVDGGPVARTEPRVPLADYIANLRAIVERTTAAGATVVLCTPTPMSRAYDYAGVGAYAQHEDINFQVRRYAQAVRDLAAELHVPLVDAFRLFEERPDGLSLIRDGNHPYVEGHALLAEALLGPVARALAGRGEEAR